MKKLTYLILAVGLLLTFAACDDNEPQSFRAADSNASFPTTTASVDENRAPSNSSCFSRG